MKQQIVIIANGAPYGSETLFNALRLGIALNEQEGIDLKLFLMSDAVSAALTDLLGKKKAALLEVNLQALNLGITSVEKEACK